MIVEQKVVPPSLYKVLGEHPFLTKQDVSLVYTRLCNKKGLEDIVLKVAERNNVPYHAVRKALAAIRHEYKCHKFLQPVDLEDAPDFVEEARGELDKILGSTKTIKKVPQKKTGRVKNVVMADIHIPFQNEDVVSQVLNSGADRLWIAGDTLDMYSAGKYRKTSDTILVREEIAQARALLEKASTRFDEVNLISGNHDTRAVKRLQEMLPELLAFFQHPLQILSQGLDNVYFRTTPVPHTKPAVRYAAAYEMDFFTVRGDVAFCHFETFCGDDAVKRAWSWVKEMQPVLKLEHSPKLIIQAHIHRLQSQTMADGTTLISPGAACLPMPYVFDSPGRYPLPVCGYTTFDTVDDIVDLSTVKLNYVGF